MRMLLYTCVVFLGVSAALTAQPTVFANGMVNAASAVPAGLPSGNIAQGSMFSIYGQNMGPDQSPALSWPLKSSEGLGGVTVQVTDSASQMHYAILLYVSPGQINAVLPSATALGTASLTVTYNGQTSAPQTFTVVRSSVGLLAWNQAGSGPGVIQQYHSGTPSFNDITNSAMPGDVGVLWGTGLGPVTFDETQPPVQTDLGVGAEVWVGGQRVTDVQYQGRSTAAGQDQINFVIPNVPGCYVPVTVKIGNVVSNTVSMAINANGGNCSDPLSYQGVDLNAVKMNGLRQGYVSLNRTTTKFAAGGMTFDTTADTASGVFNYYTWAKLLQSRGTLGVSTYGACSVFTYRGDGGATDPVMPDFLDAGNLTLTGPDGVPKTFTMSSKGVYTLSLGNSGIPGLPGGSSLYLDPGNYTVTGSGGADVGAFTATLNLPAAFTWTNVDAIAAVDRSAGVTVNWTGGAGYVIITGYSQTSTPQDAGAAFYCIEQASRGTFTVPPEVLLALPPSGTIEGTPTGILGLINQPVSVSFNPLPSGLALGTFSATYNTTKSVGYN